MKLLDQSAQTNWKFVGIVAFVAVFLAGGILMLIPQFQEQALPLPQQNTSQLEGVYPELVEGWQTYRNDEFGFEFQYPKGGRVEVFTPEARSTYLFALQIYFPSKIDPYEASSILAIYDSLDVWSSVDDLKGYMLATFQEEPKSFSLGDVSGLKNSESYFFQKDNFMYGAHIYDSLSKGEDSDTLEQILATFQFLD